MKVLVYVDPAPRGEWALAAALQLPASFSPSLLLLATEEDVAHDPQLLERAAARFGSGVVQAMRPGPAERAVVSEALARRFDLVIVPPAGRGAIARMLRGSRVATVVRAVRAAVLVARRPAPRFERVLGALSGRRSTEAVIEASLLWEALPGARARFVHVATEVAIPAAAGAARTLGGDREAVRAALRGRGLEQRLVEREGLVVDEALDEFESGADHLLVLGARDEDDQGFGREDVTERLLLACPGPTLVVPAGLTAPSISR